MALLKLPRLPQNQQLIDSNGFPTTVYVLWWQQVVEQVENSINGIALALEAAGIALDAADAAQAAADVAIAAAADAQAAVDGTTAETSIVNSFPTNYTPYLLASNNTGDVDITLHDRQYGDTTLNPTVSVDPDTLATGAAVGDIVRVYYDDATRAGGTVTYQFTIDPAAPPVQGGDRHVIGSVEVPAAGVQTGIPVRPPGYTG